MKLNNVPAGSTRVVKRFALIPQRIDQYTRVWLEFYYCVERLSWQFNWDELCDSKYLSKQEAQEYKQRVDRE